MNENIITFNFTNWITVVVMAVVGFVVFALLAQLFYKWPVGSTQNGG